MKSNYYWDIRAMYGSKSAPHYYRIHILGFCFCPVSDNNYDCSIDKSRIRDYYEWYGQE